MYCIACTTKFTDDLISIYVVSTNGLTARMFKCFRLCTGKASFFNIQYAHNLRDHLTVLKQPSIFRRKGCQDQIFQIKTCQIKNRSLILHIIVLRHVARSMSSILIIDLSPSCLNIADWLLNIYLAAISGLDKIPFTVMFAPFVG